MNRLRFNFKKEDYGTLFGRILQTSNQPTYLHRKGVLGLSYIRPERFTITSDPESPEYFRELFDHIGDVGVLARCFWNMKIMQEMCSPVEHGANCPCEWLTVGPNFLADKFPDTDKIKYLRMLKYNSTSLVWTAESAADIPDAKRPDWLNLTRYSPGYRYFSPSDSRALVLHRLDEIERDQSEPAVDNVASAEAPPTPSTGKRREKKDKKDQRVQNKKKEALATIILKSLFRNACHILLNHGRDLCESGSALAQQAHVATHEVAAISYFLLVKSTNLWKNYEVEISNPSTGYGLPFVEAYDFVQKHLSEELQNFLQEALSMEEKIHHLEKESERLRDLSSKQEHEALAMEEEKRNLEKENERLRADITTKQEQGEFSTVPIPSNATLERRLAASQEFTEASDSEGEFNAAMTTIQDIFRRLKKQNRLQSAENISACCENSASAT